MKKVFLLSLTTFLLLGFLNCAKAESDDLYLEEKQVYYNCQNEQVTPQNDDNTENDDMIFDSESVKILNNSFFHDKNGVYYGK